jgi:hypothetical protein
MTRPHYLRWLGRDRRCLAAVLVVVALGLVACTSTDRDTPQDPPTAEPTTTLPVERCLDQALFELVVEELSPAAFLDRVHEDDVEDARAIFYPDDHPHAGEYVPLDEWGDDQQRAWGLFITAPRPMNELLPMLYERLVEELTPDEFFSRLNEEELHALRDLVYPDGHTQAGEFVAAESVGMSWEHYLLTHPAGEGCPW